ncbi:MAG: cysteine desulfurase [Firmicutes bacterium]|nr:cysteine desulfurase [Bacillota bacterium]MCL1954060.1 cysteine desulfurase [Bacillota bacterium]
MKRVYLDYAATTPVDKRVLQKMLPYFTDVFGNANSQHSFGQEAEIVVDASRRKVADIFGVKPNEIYFTSGGTEADNWAIKGLGKSNKGRTEVIVSSIEHAAIMKAASQLEERGVSVKYLPVDEFGMVSPESLRAVISDKTALVSVMLANNEMGTIQPIKELASIAKAHGALFHTDAVQAVGSIPVNPKELGVDMMTVTAHKFYGPKGIAMLYIRNGIRLENRLITGGFQERTMRGGTTNVPLVVGFAEALEIAVQEMSIHTPKIQELRDYFMQEIEKNVSHVLLNGHRTIRLPQNVNYTFEYIEGEGMLFSLDLGGVACSSGSACSSGALEPSHVMLAMGFTHERAHGSIRFSLGRNTTKDDIDYTVQVIKEACEKLRKLSPLYAQFSTNRKVDSKTNTDDSNKRIVK